MLRFLTAGQKTFGGGNAYVSDAVQGAFMSDTAGFFTGYSEDTSVSFAQAANLLRAEYLWYEVHAGLIITWTELKKDGIHITDNQKKSEAGDTALFRLTSLLENRMEDYGESWARSMNTMLWADGTQDSLQVPGLTALIVPDNTGKTTGGLARNTYTWWRNRTQTDIVASAENQTLTRALRTQVRQLRRFGGKPNKQLAGSRFLEQLEIEVQAKGIYTQSGFTKTTDVAMEGISMMGVGTFEYDPTLDDRGLSHVCLFLDSRRVKLRPMEGEDGKVLTPERPYQYMVFLKSMTWTGALQATQLNCHGYFSVPQA